MPEEVKQQIVDVGGYDVSDSLHAEWFGCSDPAMEEALHDADLLRRFAGLDVFEDAMLDESTILCFWRVLENFGFSLNF